MDSIESTVFDMIDKEIAKFIGVADLDDRPVINEVFCSWRMSIISHYVSSILIVEAARHGAKDISSIKASYDTLSEEFKKFIDEFSISILNKLGEDKIGLLLRSAN